MDQAIRYNRRWSSNLVFKSTRSAEAGKVTALSAKDESGEVWKKADNELEDVVNVTLFTKKLKLAQ